VWEINKIEKIIKLFVKLEHLKNQEVIYWAERNRPTVVWIIEQLKSGQKSGFHSQSIIWTTGGPLLSAQYVPWFGGVLHH
jgi:hypothetical protein